MMKSLDDGIGQVLSALTRAGLARDTLVVVTSDNGGERFSYNWPFTGEKGALWEGGIRVPAIVRWPGVVPAARISQQPSISMDWTATLLAAGNTKADPAYPLDGINLLETGTSDRRPLTSDISHLTSRTFFWRHSNQSAVVKWPWKYLHDGTNEYLFNLEVDQRERANFRTQNPAMFEQLKKEFADWDTTVLPRLPVRVRPL